MDEGDSHLDRQNVIIDRKTLYAIAKYNLFLPLLAKTFL